MSRRLEWLFLTAPRGAMSRVRIGLYRILGLRAGLRNRIEGGGRMRHCSQIVIGNYNAFTQGCWLWPGDPSGGGVRIRVGNLNYFNRNVMIDASGSVEIGNENMFGPDVFITDSNHQHETALGPKKMPMSIGRVTIGDRCWIGAKAVILKDVTLGDGCVVAAGSIVTKPVEAGTVVAGIPARRIK
jgi:acetyltransferase-like isoleucine patch superfamily enzyme